MCRTVVNVCGDLVAATVIGATFKENPATAVSQQAKPEEYPS